MPGRLGAQEEVDPAADVDQKTTAGAQGGAQARISGGGSEGLLAAKVGDPAAVEVEGDVDVAAEETHDRRVGGPIGL